MQLQRRALAWAALQARAGDGLLASSLAAAKSPPDPGLPTPSETAPVTERESSYLAGQALRQAEAGQLTRPVEQESPVAVALSGFLLVALFEDNVVTKSVCPEPRVRLGPALVPSCAWRW